MTAIYVALVIYMVVLFGVGLFYSKKNATINDFLLAGRDLGVVAATLTVTASLFGGGLLTGSAQYAYDSGSISTAPKRDTRPTCSAMTAGYASLSWARTNPLSWPPPCTPPIFSPSWSWAGPPK